jgi:hypothetical protein
MKRAVIFFILLAFTGCGRPRQAPPALVIPSGGGIYGAVGQGFTEEEATRQAVDAAGVICEKEEMRPAVSIEESEYRGKWKPLSVTMDATRYVIFPFRALLPRGKQGDDYRVKISFNCE